MVPVDVFLPGCPPSGPTIRMVLEKVIAGEPIDLLDNRIHFGGYGKPHLPDEKNATKAPSPRAAARRPRRRIAVEG